MGSLPEYLTLQLLRSQAAPSCWSSLGGHDPSPGSAKLVLPLPHCRSALASQLDSPLQAMPPSSFLVSSGGGWRVRSVLRGAPGILAQFISAVTLRLLWAPGSFTYQGGRDQLQKFSWGVAHPNSQGMFWQPRLPESEGPLEMGTQLSFSIQWPTERSVPTAFPPLREEQEDGP